VFKPPSGVTRFTPLFYKGYIVAQKTTPFICGGFNRRIKGVQHRGDPPKMFRLCGNAQKLYPENKAGEKKSNNSPQS